MGQERGRGKEGQLCSTFTPVVTEATVHRCTAAEECGRWRRCCGDDSGGGVDSVGRWVETQSEGPLAALAPVTDWPLVAAPRSRALAGLADSDRRSTGAHEDADSSSSEERKEEEC